MNYYERHLGDYARDTGHLTLVEHGVYTLLLDRYYATERGIPADQAHRLARARTDEELAAVDSVLAEFFTLVENPLGSAWVNGRVEEELAKARQRIETARKNGSKGGRPRKTPENNPDKTHKEPAGLLPGSETGTQKKAHQAPSTNLHTPEEQKKRAGASASGSRLPADWSLPNDWREWAEAERPGLSIQAEADKFADYWRSTAGAKGRKADWQATWRNWIRNAHDQRPAPAAKPSAAADFRGKRYESTPIDQLPPDLRDAARAALAAG